ncbi:phage tail terminator protein [Variovorax sp.]|uniref:phage tail terminator protein n=1 Tax=Variovorax sp. TaxID=1871043 RepID=UPI003BA88BE0
MQIVIDRLKSQLVDLRQLRSIGGGPDLDSAMRGILVPPALVVMPMRERAVDVPRIGPTLQRVMRQLSVLYLVQNMRDATGAAALVELEPLRQRVKRALIGWVIDPDAGEPVIFTGGELVDAAGDGKLIWADEFQVIVYERGL